MTIEETLKERSNTKCELCGSTDELQVYFLPPEKEETADKAILVCGLCHAQIERKQEADPARWTFLKDSMWSEIPAVQIVSWRMLNRLKNETWASDALDMMYLDDEMLAWAKAANDDDLSEAEDIHRDSLGSPLQHGDSVVLTKSLDVKGSQINARIGTVVKNIRLVHDNTEQIEGKIEGQQIVILTKFVRKHL